MNAQTEKLTPFTWADLRRLGKQDSAGRWYPNDDIKDYFKCYRSPSRAWPNSYARAAMTAKFRRWYEERQKNS